MFNNAILLGSTGSIGISALSVMEALSIRPLALAGGKNAALMEEQARKFMPRLVALEDEDAALDLKARLRDTDVLVTGGVEGVIQAASLGADIVISAIVGIAGLRPTLAAIPNCKRLALSNKEALVCFGEEILKLTAEHSVELLPIDSEHSAIFQCLAGRSEGADLSRLILTASGGPFFGRTLSSLSDVTPKEALTHPIWSMGRKITVDSATLMNKGLELIEAMHLFRVPPDRIEVVIHPESVIHSMVEFSDRAVLAQLGPADMCLPIQYALTYPERRPTALPPLDFTEISKLSFLKPDKNTFKCLALAETTARLKGNAGAVLSGANEVAVGLFLEGYIGFTAIADLVEETLCEIPYIPSPSLDEISWSDSEARRTVFERCESYGRY